MDLPLDQDELVAAVAAVNPRTVVVLNTGSPVPMPWLDDVAAVLQVWFGGQELGDGLADVLTGAAEPSGRLPVTFPRRMEDTPAYLAHPGDDGKAPYPEGLFFGHRWYDARDIEPLFPFGHGLSYTTFKLEGLKVTPDKIGPAGEATVSVDVTNTGARAGDEVVQLYVRDRVASVTRPVRELRGFERVTLAPGERKTITFKVGPAALRFTDEQMNRVVEPGMFDLMVGTSSKTTATTPLEVVDRRTP